MLGLLVLDKSRSSKSAEVRRIWKFMTSLCSLFILASAGDRSSAWSIWCFSAEVSPVRAFLAAGAPVLVSGVWLGQGAAQFRHVPIGGPVVGKLHLFKDASSSRVILLSLGCVLSVLDGISRHGLTVSRGFHWDAVVAAGPCGPLGSTNLSAFPAIGRLW